MKIYQVIESLRIERGITKTRIAKEFDKSSAWYTDVSKGRISIKAEDIKVFSNFFQVEPSFFFDHEVNESFKKEVG